MTPEKPKSGVDPIAVGRASIRGALLPGDPPIVVRPAAESSPADCLVSRLICACVDALDDESRDIFGWRLFKFHIDVEARFTTDHDTQCRLLSLCEYFGDPDTFSFQNEESFSFAPLDIEGLAVVVTLLGVAEPYRLITQPDVVPSAVEDQSPKPGPSRPVSDVGSIDLGARAVPSITPLKDRLNSLVDDFAEGRLSGAPLFHEMQVLLQACAGRAFGEAGIDKAFMKQLRLLCTATKRKIRVEVLATDPPPNDPSGPASRADDGFTTEGGLLYVALDGVTRRFKLHFDTTAEKKVRAEFPVCKLT